MCLEEMAAMPHDLLNAIVPILVKKDIVCIGITTKGVGEHNVVNEIFQRLKDAGDATRVKFLDIRYVCDDCVNKNIPLQCRHNLHLMPPWVQPERIDVIKHMHPDPDDFLREVLGLQTNSANKPVFRKEAIEYTMNNPFDITHPAVAKVTDIFTSIDPAGNGRKSEYTVTTCIYPPAEGTPQVVRGFLFNFFHGMSR